MYRFEAEWEGGGGEREGGGGACASESIAYIRMGIPPASRSKTDKTGRPPSTSYDTAYALEEESSDWTEARDAAAAQVLQLYCRAGRRAGGR